MARPSVWALVLALQVPLGYAQDTPSDRLQVKPPIAQPMTVPSANATVEELEHQGDRLREQKLYFDALDFYRAALRKDPDSAKLNNKAGMAELQGEHVGESVRYFKRAIKLDPKMAAAHNNLGAARYEERKFGSAVKEYKKAIKLEEDASFYSNLGSVYFSQKKWQQANQAYGHALQLDPDLFTR
ncbi:MAG: tetratricopeptide repeat protein, partial [Candidatus Angelobacter sp.]